VIVFGVAVTQPKTYERIAAPGIRRAAEPDSVVLAYQMAGSSLFRNYNLLLDQAAVHEDLEALVLVHQDVEIVEADFAARVRKALRDPDVAVVGCVGAVGVRGIAWWEGAVSWASFSHRYEEFGGGEFPSLTWEPESAPAHAASGEVDVVDGIVMVLSPWAARKLRFDESLGQLHGYDFDICMQARAAGKKVVTADFRAIHHHSLDLVTKPQVWIETYVRLAEKWASLLPDTGSDPSQRALRAEAEAACARAIGHCQWLKTRALTRRLESIQAQLRETRQDLKEARQQSGITSRELNKVREQLRAVREELSRTNQRV
jgi:Glycosyltransferase like family